MSLSIRILACLGTTAGAEIYAVEFPAGDPRTLKVLLGDDAEARYHAEQAWRSQSGHPAVLNASGDYRARRGPALALPPLDGATLATLAQGAPLPARVAVSVGALVGGALQGAPPELSARHLSAEDILVTAAGEVYLIDPGSGPALAAPADPRALSYRLGALLFALVTGGALPRPSALELPWERAVRRSLEAASVEAEASQLLRRLVAWSPERRPRPDAAIAGLLALSESLGGLTLARWAAARAGLRSPSPETGALWELEGDAPDGTEDAGVPEDAASNRYAFTDDSEMLFFPDTTAEAVQAPDEPADEPADEPEPFPPLFARAPVDLAPLDEEATDPEHFSSVSAEDNTDPEPVTQVDGEEEQLLDEEPVEEAIVEDASSDGEPAVATRPATTDAARALLNAAGTPGPWIVAGVMAVLAAVASYAALG